MKMTKLRFITLSIVLAMLLLAFGRDARRTSAGAKASDGKFALLIGIDKYRSPDVNPLHGAVADAKHFKSLLETPKFGFAEANINILLDEEATGDGIVKAFQRLIASVTAYKHTTGKEAVVFFSFSGHGSQVPVPDGVKKPDEPDGLDETIVPYDSRTRDEKGDHYDIIDDDIGDFIAAVNAQTSNAVFVFDSCHSGHINRGVGTSREAKRDERPQPVTQLPSTVPHAKVRPNVFGDENEGSFAIITGSLPEEKSQETDLADGSTRGLMSYYLENELGNVTSDTTYGDLIARVAAEVSAKAGGIQHPQVSGSATKRILDGTIKDGPQLITVVEADDKTLTITAGQMDGLSEGSLVAFYDGKQIDPHGTNGKLGEGSITKTFLNRSVVSFTPLEGSHPTRDEKLSARAVLLSPLFGTHPLAVTLPEGNDPIVAEVHDRLLPYAGPTGLVRLNDAGAKLDPSGVSLRKGPFRPAFCGGLPKAASPARCEALLPPSSKDRDGKMIPLPAADAEVYYIVANSTFEALYGFFARPGSPNAALNIEDALKKCARQRNLLSLENLASTITAAATPTKPGLAVEFVQVTSDARCAKTPGPDTVLPRPTNRTGFKIAAGTCYKLRITNNSERPLYVTVLDLSTDGAINTMWPTNEGAPQKLLPGAPPIETNIWRITKPLGNEVYRIIATTTPTNYRGLQQGRVMIERGAANESPLTKLLNDSMEGRSRGGPDEPPDTDSWSILSPFAVRITP